MIYLIPYALKFGSVKLLYVVCGPDDDIRKYRNMSSFGVLLSRLTPTLKSQTRKLEKLEKKQANCISGVTFLSTCIKEKLLPKFTDIRSYDPATREQDFTVNYRQ